MPSTQFERLESRAFILFPAKRTASGADITVVNSLCKMYMLYMSGLNSHQW